MIKLINNLLDGILIIYLFIIISFAFIVSVEFIGKNFGIIVVHLYVILIGCIIGYIKYKRKGKKNK